MYLLIFVISFSLGGLLGYRKHKQMKKNRTTNLSIPLTKELNTLQQSRCNTPEIMAEDENSTHLSLINMLILHCGIEYIQTLPQKTKGLYFSLPSILFEGEFSNGIYLRDLGENSWGVYKNKKESPSFYIQKHHGFDQHYEIDSGECYYVHYDKELNLTIIHREKNGSSNEEFSLVFSIDQKELTYIGKGKQ